MLRKILTGTVDVEKWLPLIRIVAGVLILKNGWGTFSAGHMEGNIAWLTDVHMPAPAFMAYLGKITELVGGVMLIFGLFTRFFSMALVINMAVISFVMQNGNVLDDQYPFLLLIVFLFLSITGGGKYSADHWLFKR